MNKALIPTAGAKLTTKRMDALVVGDLIANGHEFARVVDHEVIGNGQVRLVVKRRYKRIETTELANEIVKVKAIG